MLVSCIMPTFNRRKTIPYSLKCYLSQDWQDKELIVIDDGESVEDMFDGVDNLIYVHRRDRMSLGAKKNLACDLASGEVIIHWDDDDWSAPTRISEQVGRLLASGKPVTGYCKLLFWDVKNQRATKYDGDRNYSCDSSLCYRKEYWSANRFREDLAEKEDHGFAYKAARNRSLEPADGGTSLIAVTHAGNTSLIPRHFPSVDPAIIPSEFMSAIECVL